MDDAKLIAMAFLALRLDNEAAPPPWTVEHNETKKCLTVHAGAAWRRRPSRARGQWAPLTDVMTMTGGFSAGAVANVNFVTSAREALPALSLEVLRRLLNDANLTKDQVVGMTEPKDNRPLTDLEADKYLRHRIAMYQRRDVPSNALSRLLDALADALDEFFSVLKSAGIGDERDFPITDDEQGMATGADRLVKDGNYARERRADLLQQIVYVIRTTWDHRKSLLLHPSSRVDHLTRPRVGDFRGNLPPEIRQALDKFGRDELQAALAVNPK